MMSAKEMFENLGYSLKVEHNDFIEYSKEDFGHIDFYFLIETKRFYSRYCFSPSFQSTYHSITLDEFEAVQKQMKELGWLDEKTETEVTNLEYYKDEILEKCMWNLALVDGKPKRCNQTRCNDCEFNKDIPRKCHKRTIEWLKQTHIKPTYKLTQFEYDLLSVHKDYKTYNQIANQTHLFKMHEKGYFKGVDDNELIGDILTKCEVV